MSRRPLRGRTIALAAVIAPLLALFVYVALRSGPLAPVAVTVTTVQARALTPARFGIGAIEARHTYKIGPTFAGRVRRVEVQVGDHVRAGQVLGEMEPVDLDERVRVQDAAVKRAQASMDEAEARQTHAQAQARRYEQLFAAHALSDEGIAARRQDAQIGDAALGAAREELARASAERAASVAQRGNLRLIAPVDGIVAARDADPGSTVVAGQSVLELIDPASLWINVRFDQIGAAGLAAGLPARIALRSRDGAALRGHVLRIEPKADAVTEEMLAKVGFDQPPSPPPAVGELAEVTLDLAPLAAAPTLPNAAIRRDGAQLGVWRIIDGAPRFTPVRLGAADLDGMVQVRAGLAAGERVVLYSAQALNARSRIDIVEHIPGTPR